MRTRDDLESLVAAYALDAVDGDERLEVEEAVSRDPALRSQLDEYLATASILAQAVEFSPSTPSPLVWSRIEATIAGERSGKPALATMPNRRSRLSLWISATVSMAALSLAFAMVAVTVDQNQKITVLEAAMAGNRLEQAAAQASSAPGSTEVTLASPGGSALATVVIGTDGVGYLLDDTLPTLDPSRTYQLWAIVDDRVISAGVLGSNPGVSPFQIVGDLAGLAITEEVAGGVVSSQNDAVALWLKDAT